ncbi:uncharacterized protein LOC124889613 [Capsicum annuum]|uniref:uncharacterized protein LOC124889613 n=1 Tax=Capsicum annuum TaxID=4072 RepID=UPI001FB1732C|nr:uncharacterized protein LOC124889613 [Capsicum annuum]
MGGSMVNIISAYASQVGLDEEEKKEFWEVLDEVVRNIPSTEKLFVGGDFNGYIGSLPRRYDDVHGGFIFGERNEGGTSLMDFFRAFGLWIENLSFSKKEDHLITFYSSVAKTQIEFLLLRKGDKALCKDCSVLRDLEISEEGRDYSYCRHIKVEEVKGSIRRMRRGRAARPDEISVDFWKSTSGVGLKWLTRLFNIIFRAAKMLEAWR